MWQPLKIAFSSQNEVKIFTHYFIKVVFKRKKMFVFTKKGVLTPILKLLE